MRFIDLARIIAASGADDERAELIIQADRTAPRGFYDLSPAYVYRVIGRGSNAAPTYVLTLTERPKMANPDDLKAILAETTANVDAANAALSHLEERIADIATEHDQAALDALRKANAALGKITARIEADAAPAAASVVDVPAAPAVPVDVPAVPETPAAEPAPPFVPSEPTPAEAPKGDDGSTPAPAAPADVPTNSPTAPPASDVPPAPADGVPTNVGSVGGETTAPTTV